MRPPLANGQGESGFTLVEALVALVLLSVGLLAFYEFLGSALHAADRARHAAEGYDHDQNALALASTLNPMATPDGTFDLGTYRIRWRSEPLTAAFHSTSFPFPGQGQFLVALYRVTLDFPDDLAFAPVTVTKLGYHRETSSGPPSGEPSN
jgi:prepilin-type N-terminal cleavage/methylation domain-containing protein